MHIMVPVKNFRAWVNVIKFFLRFPFSFKILRNSQDQIYSFPFLILHNCAFRVTLRDYIGEVKGEKKHTQKTP